MKVETNEWIYTKARELVEKFGSKELALKCVWEMVSSAIFLEAYCPFTDKVLASLRLEINLL